MNSAIERLIGLRVRDVMASDVVTINDDSTMAEAAEVLRDYGITGVPVSDALGRCIGVLSASDFVVSKSEDLEVNPVSHVIATLDATGLTRAEVVSNELVRAFMSPNVLTIDEHRSVIQAGRMMCHEHVHRLVVVDRKGRPVGIVSSLDLVSAMVNVVEE